MSRSTTIHYQKFLLEMYVASLERQISMRKKQHFTPSIKDIVSSGNNCIFHVDRNNCYGVILSLIMEKPL